MTDQQTHETLVIRIATPADIAIVNHLDSFSASPTRDIHRDVHKYFGSVDPSTHEKTVIFLADVEGTAAAKVELMLPPAESISPTGYVKRVIVHPDFRGRGLSKYLLNHVIDFAASLNLKEIDLHVWDQNQPAIHLYESLGFELQHRELYYRLPITDATPQD